MFGKRARIEESPSAEPAPTPVAVPAFRGVTTQLKKPSANDHRADIAAKARSRRAPTTITSPRA